MPSISSSHTSLVFRYLPVALIAAVAGYYFLFLYRHALNIPHADDIYDVLAVIVALVQSGDWQTSASVLLEQHNEHRTASSRLVYYLAYLAQGEVNFRTLTFLANLALPLFLIFYFLRLRATPNRWWLLLPAAFALLQLRAFDLTLWSMASFAYCFVFLYGFACIYCLHGLTKIRLLFAINFAILASFTLASGPIVWVVGLVSLLHQRLVCQSISTWPIAAWVAAASMTLALWSYGMESSVSAGQVVANISAAPLHNLHFYLALVGSAVSASKVWFATVTGALIVLAVLGFSLSAARSRDIRLELCCWYILASAVAMVVGRAYFTEVEYALVSRYSFPSVLILSAVWVLIAERLDVRATLISGGAVLVSFIYCVSSYAIYSEPLQAKVEFRMKRYNSGNYPLWGRSTKESNQVVADAIARGIYLAPPRTAPSTKSAAAKRKQLKKGKRSE